MPDVAYDSADGYLTASKFNAPRRTYFPSEVNSPDSFHFDQDYIQLRTEFVPLALDTQNEDDPTCYLTAESPLEDFGGGLVKFTRTWARIPSSWRDYESYAWTIPGLEASGDIYAIRFVTGQLSAGGTDSVTLNASAGASVGDRVTITYNITTPDGTITRRILRTVTGGGGTTVQFASVADVTTPSYQTVQKVDIGREPRTEVVGSVIFRDYFLPGVTVNTPTVNDIPILRPDTIIDNTGNQTQSYGITTTPSRSDWLTLVAANTLVVVESSIVRRWQGNIYERSTRYCVAI